MWNFLKTFVQIVLMLLGLTGLVDDVVEWKGFLRELVVQYEMIRDYAFAFLPFDLYEWMKDYLVIGAVVASSLIRTAAHIFSDDEEIIFRNFDTFAAFMLVFAIVTNWHFWPLMVIILNAQFLRDPTYFADYEMEIAFLRNFWVNVGWTIAIFIGLVFIASDAPERILS